MRDVQVGIAITVIALVGLVMVACNRGSSGQSTATATPSVTQNPTPVSPGPTTTTTPSVEEDIAAAYRRYWEIYAEALFELEEGKLAEVMTGPRLERGLEEIKSLRADRQAVRSVLDLDPAVVSIRENEATVIDEYENGSYLIDPVTKEPIAGHGSPVLIREAFTLVHVEGVWKVFDSVRQAAPN